MYSKKNIKTVSLLTFFLLFAKMTGYSAGTITTAEYFIDSDPGEGNGVALAAKDGSFNSSLEEVDISLNTSALSIGVHHLYVRMKNDADTWGTPRIITFNIEGNQFIASQEYFIDTDPGAGNRIPLTAVDGNFNQKRENGIGAISTSSLSAGLHNLYVRAQNAEGH